VPSPKGAAIHIEQFARGIAEEFGPLQLATISRDGQLNSSAFDTQIDQVEIPAPGNDVITRVMNFRRLLKAWMNERSYEVIQFRSPFEGYWIACDKQRYCRTLIYEVNGLPSVELKYRYPKVAEDEVLLDKLIAQEQKCFAAADLVVTTCLVSKRYLISRDVPTSKIVVIPNGVQLDVFKFSSLPPLECDERFRLIYFGTLSSWQGADFALRTVAALLQDVPVQLTIVGPGTAIQLRSLQELATKLGITNHVCFLAPVSQSELLLEIHKSHAIVAPLTANDRNLEQGCCPLKVLEGMATGRPVIASDLEVVREIASNETVILAKCGSVQSWKEAISYLRENYILATQLTVAARSVIESRYSWDRARQQLNDSYRTILNNGATTLAKS
jgi:glycosyltransferase involved in cell wall biosynthesis